MRVRRFPAALLGLALLLSQWLSFAHAFEHPALAADAVCAVCLAGAHLDDGAPLPSAPVLATVFAQDTVALPPTLLRRATQPATVHARGPPSK